MKTPYYIMPTEDGSARIFFDKKELHRFAAIAAEQLTEMLAHIEAVVSSDNMPGKSLTSLAYDMSWQISQAVSVLRDGPEAHHISDWTLDEHPGATPAVQP